MKQGTEEWLKARLGKVTASRVYDILPGTRGYKASRKNYMAELVCERLTGAYQDMYVSAPMQWGTDTEPMARGAYEAKTGHVIEEVGFVDHPSIDMFGASPDGLVPPSGGVEIKCPNTATHIELLTGGSIDDKYMTQMYVNMMCNERKWWDYIDYDPRLPEGLDYYSKRIDWNDSKIAEITVEVRLFLAELDAMEQKLRTIAGGAK